MENQISYKPHSSLFLKIRNEAPSITVSENYGRSGGYYGDEDIETRGYRAVLIYIQLGLAGNIDLFLNTARLVLSVQKGACIRYPLVPLGFGTGNKLIHEGKYFDLGFSNDYANDFKIAETLMRISGNEVGNIPSIIPELYPKAGIRNLYGGKARVDESDLLVFIGKKNEVAFSSVLGPKINSRIKRHILLVEIEEDKTNWNFINHNILFN